MKSGTTSIHFTSSPIASFLSVKRSASPVGTSSARSVFTDPSTRCRRTRAVSETADSAAHAAQTQRMLIPPLLILDFLFLLPLGIVLNLV